MNHYRIFYLWIAGTMLLLLSSLLFIMVPVQAPDPPHPFAGVSGAVETPLSPDVPVIHTTPGTSEKPLTVDICSAASLRETLTRLVSNAKAIRIFVGRQVVEEDQWRLEAELGLYNTFLAHAETIVDVCWGELKGTSDAP